MTNTVFLPKFWLSVLFLLLTKILLAETSQADYPPLDYSKALYAAYPKFKEKQLTHRRFKHKDIIALIQQLPFEKQVVGRSFEQRDIYQIKLGTGKTRVMLWSQMHGDESTATMALFDIFNFFQAKNDEFDAFRNTILSACTLYFVPMLNPDGAERFQRRTATEIDMNRDALRLQTPEGVLLKQLRDNLTPEFAFNLHDQGTRTSAGNSPKQATISFLATAYDNERHWNKVRKKSMQVICGMNDVLQQFAAGHIAKYSDEHEPRAFGDNIQKWGSSLILIESGGYKEDTEKQFIRQLNFVAILTAFQSIAEENYRKHKLKEYEALPINDGYLFDLLVRNVTFVENGQTILKDIGINLNEKNKDNATHFTLESRVEDLGDLSTFWGIKEINGAGLTLKLPKDAPTQTIKLALSDKQLTAEMLKRGDEATFFLERNGQIAFTILNGLVLPK
jgi:Zinc carboxypeptidase